MGSRITNSKTAVFAAKTGDICRAMDWDQEQLKAKLAELELEHRDLDDVINSLTDQGDFDQIKVSRLKKRKLALKDQITTLRGRLIPDIIA
jgi:hypothetical protein